MNPARPVRPPRADQIRAAEIIATPPTLGFGLGAYLDQRQSLSQMPVVMAAVIIILTVGIGIELLVLRPAERRILRARGRVVGR